MMRTPDGHSRLDLSRFDAPAIAYDVRSLARRPRPGCPPPRGEPDRAGTRAGATQAIYGLPAAAET